MSRLFIGIIASDDGLVDVARDVARQHVGAVEAVEARELEPLTERVLARLPGDRWAWVVAWALVPWANAGINLLLDAETKSAVWGRAERSSS